MITDNCLSLNSKSTLSPIKTLEYSQPKTHLHIQEEKHFPELLETGLFHYHLWI
jgi:hypothetical protein